MPSVKVKDSLVLNSKRKRKTLQQTPSTVKPLKLPPISTIPKEHQEKWDIQALPSDWKVDTKPSKVVQKLFKKRQQEHEETIENMRNAMTEVNTKIEDEIRVASTLYKQRLKVSKKELEECMDNIRQMLKGSADLCFDNFAIAVDNVKDIYKINKYQLFMLNQKLKDLERSRSVSFKAILKKAYARLNEISYKLPFEIQEYFEQEIQVINEITLNNVSAYDELKCQLKLELGNEIRLWFQEIQYIRDIWLYYVKLMVFTNLNQNELFDKDCNQQVLLNKSEIRTVESSYSSSSYWQQESSINTSKMFEWVNKIENAMNHIDSCAKMLVLNFKGAVMKVVQGYFDEMRNTAQRIFDLGLIRKSEINIVKSEFCGQAVMDVANKYTKELNNVQNMWTNIKKELQVNLEESFVFLNHFSEIWHFHLQRITVIKSAISKDLDRVRVEGYLLASEEESKINIMIDTARQESLQKNLTNLMADISKSLDNLKNIYNQNCQNECSGVAKIMEFLKMEGELLESELGYFLSSYYDIETTDNQYYDDLPTVTKSFVQEQMESVSSDSSEISPEMIAARYLLSSEIQKCKAQIKLLHRWKAGLYKILNKYMQDCKDENATLGKQWIREEEFKAKIKLKILLQVLHEPRYKRFKPVIYNLRLAEMDEQANRFKEHKAGLDQEVSNACLIYPKYEEQYNKVLEKSKADIENIRNRVKNATNSAIVTSAMTTFDCTMLSCMKKIVQVNDIYQTDFASGISLIFNCNLNYLKAIKLFSEGGNFNFYEAREICNQLSKIEKLYKKKIAMVAGQNDKKCSKCLQILNSLKFETFELLSKYEDELKYYDSCVYKIKDVQTEIKNEVYFLKFKEKQLISHLNGLWEISEKSIGQPQKVQYFVQQVKKLIPIIEEYKSFLERPNFGGLGRRLSKLSQRSTISKRNNSVQSVIKKLQIRIKSTTNLSSVYFKDYSSYLFDGIPTKEKCFIGKIRYLLYTSYKSLQKQGKQFYEKHLNTEFINTDKIHLNYQDFVSETLPKYIYYYLQCEIVWLEHANEYIKTMGDILANLRIHHNDSIQKFVEDSLKEMREVSDSVLMDISEIKSQHKTEFSTLYKKLKPLHGYPGNKAMLEALNTELQTFFELKCGGHLDLLSSYRNNFNVMESDYVVGLFHINDNLEALKKLYEEKGFSRNIMMDFVDTILCLMKFVPFPPESQSFDDVLKNAGRKLEFYKKSIVIPSEYILHVSRSTILCNTPSSSSQVNLTDNTAITHKIEIFTSESEELFNKIESVVEENKEIINYWRAMWDKAVQSVVALYKVKYD